MPPERSGDDVALQLQWTWFLQPFDRPGSRRESARSCIASASQPSSLFQRCREFGLACEPVNGDAPYFLGRLVCYLFRSSRFRICHRSVLDNETQDYSIYTPKKEKKEGRLSCPRHGRSSGARNPHAPRPPAVGRVNPPSVWNSFVEPI